MTDKFKPFVKKSDEFNNSPGINWKELNTIINKENIMIEIITSDGLSFEAKME
mgnify:CR=1 FL=1